MSQLYTYDAFISYRHLPLDEAVASRVQELLERYRPPKEVGGSKRARIERIFRDKTELPTSGDLDTALKRALLGSRFLIVILSEETKHSKWCMEEIRLFKEAHGGNVDHILPVLVSGEPADAIPDELRFESRVGEDGMVVSEEIEPLCCDVRGDSTSDTMKRLKTEYLRLAAPLLDCGFDELYQRHKRRARQQRILGCVGVSALALVLGIAGYSSLQSRQRYRNNLLHTYLQQGSQLAETDAQQAMAYYSGALALDEGSQAAETGALMLLQQHTWWNKVGEIREESAPAVYMKEYGSLLNSSEDGSCYTFWDGTTITYYFPEKTGVYQLTMPTQINPACKKDSSIEPKPYAMAVGEGRAVVRYGGYLYIYDLTSDGQAVLYETFDLAHVFEEDAKQNALDVWNVNWADVDGSHVVLYNGASAAVFLVTGKTPCLTAVHTTYGYDLRTVSFAEDGQQYALVYGNDFGLELYDPGGYVEVYHRTGNLLMKTPLDTTMAPAGAVFEPGGERLSVWGSSELQLQEATLDESSEEWYLDLASIYLDRVYALLLEGYGANAFQLALDEAYEDLLADILIDYHFDVHFYLVLGKADRAADSMNRYLEEVRALYDEDPVKAEEEVRYRVMSYLLDLHMLEQRGAIAEADLSAFVEGLSVTVGIELKQMSAANLRAGLRLEDLLTTVDEVRIFDQYHPRELMETHPTASLTIRRDGLYLTTDPIEEWSISGAFYAK